MKIKCEYCDSFIEDTDEVCPNCGAVNKGYKRASDQTPKTIEELKQWYESKNLPPYETTRFFIGIDYKEPKAFGIYKDENTGRFIVYKNKDTGDRAVRYDGADEAYAVNEIYLKLNEEIAKQKAGNIAQKNAANNAANSGTANKKKSGLSGCFGILIVAAIVLGLGKFCSDVTPSTGYYNYDGSTYYYQDDTWYMYDYYDNDWYIPDSVPSELSEDYDSYYDSYDYNSNDDASDFSQSQYYEESTYDSSDWDSDSSWDSSDSWDSSSSDWGSDW